MNEERLKISKKLKSIIVLLEDEKNDDKEVAKSINDLIKILGPDFERIPQDLKKSLGLAYGSAIAETDTIYKAVYTRTALSLLRGATRIARGTKLQIIEIDNHIKRIDKEIGDIEGSEEPLLDNLWKAENRAIDYLTEKIFEGYGQFSSAGFQFKRKEADA